MLTTSDTASSKKPAQGLGFYLSTGRQDVTVASPDGLRTVIAEPDLSTAKEVFEQAEAKARTMIPSLDFSNDDAAHSSIAILLAIFDSARRTVNGTITRQYVVEMAKIDRLEASWSGTKQQLLAEEAIINQVIEE